MRTATYTRRPRLRTGCSLSIGSCGTIDFGAPWSGSTERDAELPNDMARIWRGALDPERHRDFMTGAQDAGGRPLDGTSGPYVYFVRECGFTMEFPSLEHVREARDWFADKTHASSRRPGVALEHYWQRWFERLPKGLVGGTKRTRMLAALDRALEEFGGDAAVSERD